MGYFHGYKGYRYHNKPNNQFSYNSFDEIQAVYDFDMALKAIFYSQIMFLETTLKNYALEVILEESGSKRFADVYANIMTNYKKYTIGSTKYKKAIAKRMNVRNKVYVYLKFPGTLRNLKAMGQCLHFGKSVQDNGYGLFREMLDYKLAWKGKKMVKVDRFFPSSKKCCKCGRIKKELKLSERIYHCECGNEMGRDRNAAINIREEARRMLTA